MKTDKFDYDFDTFFALIFYDLLLSVLVLFTNQGEQLIAADLDKYS